MILWLVFAVMTAGVLAVILRPLLLGPTSSAPSADTANLAVYRDQLAEIARERDRGLLGGADAEAAHAEVARRLLASAAASESSSPASPSVPPHAIAAGLAIAAPLIAVGAYLLLGSPGLPGLPFHARLESPVATAGVSDLIARVEARLGQNPDDGQGWDVIAPVYLAQQRYQDAADAFARSLQLLGESSRRLAGFAEATTMAHDGIVTEPARAAYARLAALEPARVEPRYWLAVASEQDGQLAAAGEVYAQLLKEADPHAPWRAAVEQRLEAVRGRLASGGKARVAAAEAEQAKGPTAEDMQAAANLSPEARAAFIDQMVAGLAERLKKETHDLGGWQKLIRAYTVLGRRGEAVAALGNARRHFEGNAQSLDALDALAKSLGLGS